MGGADTPPGPRFLDPRYTAAVVFGAHDWTEAGMTRAPSVLRSAKGIVAYLIDSAGLALDSTLVIDLFDDTASAGEQLTRIRDSLNTLLRDRREEERPVADLLVYYVGHGYTDDQGHLSLLVRRSRQGMEAETGIKAPELARILKIAAPQQRRVIILDCCFSEAAVRDFIGQSGALDEAVATIAVKDLRDDQPRRGTLLLCSSPKGEVSIGPPRAERTLFTGAVLDVLRQGVENKPSALSLAEVRDAAYDRMVVGFGANAPRPALHQVNQAHGDLTRTPAFPNRRAAADRVVSNRTAAEEVFALGAPLTSVETPQPAPVIEKPSKPQSAAMVISQAGDLIRAAAEAWPEVRDSRKPRRLERFRHHFAGTWHAEEASDLLEEIEAEAARQREAEAERRRQEAEATQRADAESREPAAEARPQAEAEAVRRRQEAEKRRAGEELLRAEGRVAFQAGDRSKTNTLWLKPGSCEPFRDLDGGPEMVVLPAGRFEMGSPKDEPERFEDEGPRHTVAIALPFAVGRYAVTRGQFAAFVAATGRSAEGSYIWTGSEAKFDPKASWRHPGYPQEDDHPVVCVDWNDATAYVKWLEETTGKPYRLLTEAEWEYAARAGTTTSFWWGSAITPAQANYDGNFVYKGGGKKGEYRKGTVPVESFAPNPWGLYNVHGNVWEWCEDVWHASYEGAPSDGTAWTTGDSNRRVVRGGSWSDIPRYLRAANRGRNTDRVNDIGFRVGRTLTP